MADPHPPTVFGEAVEVMRTWADRTKPMNVWELIDGTLRALLSRPDLLVRLAIESGALKQWHLPDDIYEGMWSDQQEWFCDQPPLYSPSHSGESEGA